MRPLDGIFILDLSRVLAAPLGTSMLAEMGADVVRVERPGVGDELRGMPPFHRDYPDVSAYFFLANRHKKSITVNIKDKAGQDIVRDLAKQADVVVENYVPGTLAQYGLDYDSLKNINERLVYVSSSGFGQTGPYSKRKGYDTIFQAMSGITGMTGHPDGEPTKVGFPVSDMSASLWVMISIMLGLRGGICPGMAITPTCPCSTPKLH